MEGECTLHYHHSVTAKAIGIQVQIRSDTTDTGSDLISTTVVQQKQFTYRFRLTLTRELKRTFCIGNCPRVGLARTVHTYTVYDRVFGGFSAKITVYTPYINGSGQPYPRALIYAGG